MSDEKCVCLAQGTICCPLHNPFNEKKSVSAPMGTNGEAIPLPPPEYPKGWDHGVLWVDCYSRGAVENIVAQQSERIRHLERELSEHKAARIAYANEFSLNADGEPDVGSIHANIRTLKRELGQAKAAFIGSENARKDAERARPTDADPTHDPLYDKAVMIVRTHNRASLSLVQRHLVIGYNRTARLFEAMEANGVVSACDSKGHRRVLAAAPTPLNGKEEAK
jgi:hypothetical protein